MSQLGSMSAIAALLHGADGLHHVDDEGGAVLSAAAATLERRLPVTAITIVVRILKYSNKWYVIFEAAVTGER
ncbi:hypothetical protein RR48_13721 [Papilio machaon]|uniref:Uncharacterized protein n=1 Tax=Papilio machaon TaxID=76193 RepID=A0A194RHR2_PAPMA|nr:hypothetical protein RR48_13721 [Papilio machaon]